jgi:hypothetical protein
VNRDGFADLLVQFATQETGLGWGDEEACVSGTLSHRALNLLAARPNFLENRRETGQ